MLTIVYMPHSGVMHLLNGKVADAFTATVPLCGAQLMGPTVVLPEVVPAYAKCGQCTEVAAFRGLTR